MKIYYLVIIVFLFGCEEDKLVCIDDVPCISLNTGIEILSKSSSLEGECRVGKLNCSENICVGFKGPEEESCDGLDNDCNGIIDDSDFLIPFGNKGNPCQKTSCGICNTAEFDCRNGEMVCINKSELEICNGLDDDCDCEIDEIPIEFNYSGPPETVGIGECQPSITSCIDSEMRTIPEVLPTNKELCHDGLDNDCDGLIDETEDIPQSRSIVMVIDVSGSMSDNIMALSNIFCDFALRRPIGTWFAIVAVAYGTNNVAIQSDFTDPANACNVMSQTALLTGSAEEPQLDGIINGVGLNWPSQDRAVIVISDESIQPQQYTVENVLDSCVDNDFEIFVITEMFLFNEWNPIINNCGGNLANINQSSSYLEAELESWFLSSCASVF